MSWSSATWKRWNVVRASYAALAWCALAMAGCGGSDGGSAGVPSATPFATAAAGGSARKLPTQPGPLEPGTYITSIKPRLKLTLGRGWRVLNDATVMYGDDPQAGPLLSIVQPPRVVDPRRSFIGEKIPADALTPTPRDLAGWFARHPRMKGRLLKNQTLAGRRVQRVDVEVTRGYRHKGCPKACVVIFAFGPGAFGFVTEGSVVRAYMVDTPSGEVAIAILGEAARLAEVGEVAEKVLRNARFVDDGRG